MQAALLEASFSSTDLCSCVVCIPLGWADFRLLTAKTPLIRFTWSVGISEIIAEHCNDSGFLFLAALIPLLLRISTFSKSVQLLSSSKVICMLELHVPENLSRPYNASFKIVLNPEFERFVTSRYLCFCSRAAA